MQEMSGMETVSGIEEGNGIEKGSGMETERKREKGILYGVGVGPGDPELITVKAVRILQECDVVAVPQTGEGEKTAWNIARPYIADKPVLSCDMPMTRDAAIRAACHDKAANAISALLEQGKTVVFLTLGDSTIYSTYGYIHQRILQRGYEARFIPGVPSFCAAAAATGQALCEDGEMLHIIPASHATTETGLDLPGSKVLMKAGKELLAVRDKLQQRGQLTNAVLVERCGMAGERIWRDWSTLHEPTGYFSVVLVKEQQQQAPQDSHASHAPQQTVNHPDQQKEGAE